MRALSSVGSRMRVSLELFFSLSALKYRMRERMRCWLEMLLRLRTLLNSSYVAHGSNVTRRQPRILVQKLEFYWSSSLEEPPEGHVYLVAKHLDPKRLFLSKNGSLPPWPNPLFSSSASLPIQPEFNPEITQQKPSRAKSSAGSFSQRSRTGPKPRGNAAMGIPIPLRCLLVALLVLSSVALHVAAAKTIDPYKVRNLRNMSAYFVSSLFIICKP